MRPRVYISGPISNGGRLTNPGDQLLNAQKAIQAGMAVFKAGGAPLIPHLSVYLPEEFKASMSIDDFMDWDLPWVMMADAVYRLPGDSVGSDEEVACAKNSGIPVLYTESGICDWIAAEAKQTKPGAQCVTLAKFAIALASAEHPSSQNFYAALAEAAELHARKQRDYGRQDDPFANVRASEDLGIEPWVGALLRMNDKMGRLKTYCMTHKLANEGVIDSLMDIAVYALIAAVLFQESANGNNDAPACSDRSTGTRSLPATGNR